MNGKPKATKKSDPVLSLGLSQSGRAILIRVLAPNVLYDRTSLRAVQEITKYPVELIRRTLAPACTHREYFLCPLAETTAPDGWLAGLSLDEVAQKILPLLKYHAPASASPKAKVSKPSKSSKSSKSAAIKL